MYKQKPGDPLKKLDSPTTFREDSAMMKLAKDGSNPMFKMDSGIYKGHEDDKKKPLKDKKKLGTENMSYEEKMAYYKKQREAKTPKNSSVSMGMGNGYTTLNKGD